MGKVIDSLLKRLNEKNSGVIAEEKTTISYEDAVKLLINQNKEKNY